MQIVTTGLCDVKLLSPQCHRDARGWFAETFNTASFAAAGLPGTFVQDNQSSSGHGVLRGLHYQLAQPQGKLVRVLQGHIWDVVVDLRRSSPQFGQWRAFDLRPFNNNDAMEMLWIPEGYAHGFLVLSPTADVLYKVTRPYHPASERTILWDDPDLRIDWPLDLLSDKEPKISPKDVLGTRFAFAETF